MSLLVDIIFNNTYLLQNAQEHFHSCYFFGKMSQLFPIRVTNQKVAAGKRASEAYIFAIYTSHSCPDSNSKI